MQPLFQHNCPSCIFLGGDNKHDLYYCPQDGHPTVIARFGNEGGDYMSGLQIAKLYEEDSNREGPCHVLLDALKFAQKRGLCV